MLDVDIDIPTPEDIAQLERWRQSFAAADLELPEDYASTGVATAVARDTEGKLLGSLTTSIILAASLDPLLLRPDAPRASRFAGTWALTKTMEYQAKLNGAAAGFIAVPNLLTDYKEFVKRFGYEVTAQNCTLYRKSFRRAA